MSRPRVSSDAAEMRETSRAHEEIHQKRCRICAGTNWWNVPEIQGIYSIKIVILSSLFYLLLCVE